MALGHTIGVATDGPNDAGASVNWESCQSRITPSGPPATSSARSVKRGMAEMLKGGVIMDVVTAEQAKIAEDAGRCGHGARTFRPTSARKAAYG